MIAIAACSPYPSIRGKISVGGYSLETGTAGIYLFDHNARSTENMHRITPEEIDAGNYAWTPDGKSLIFNCHKKDLWVGMCIIDRSGENFEILVTDNGLGNYSFIYNPMALSPNGEAVVFAKLVHWDPVRSELYRMDIETRKIQTLLQIDTEIHVISWSPDGKNLALTLYQFEDHLLDLETLDLEFMANVYHGVWSTDGRYLALSFKNPHYYLYSVEDGHIDVTFDHKGICMHSDGLAMSPDGGNILFISLCGESDRNYGLYIVNVDSGKVKRLDKLNRGFPVNPESIQRPAWVPELKD